MFDMSVIYKHDVVKNNGTPKRRDFIVISLIFSISIVILEYCIPSSLKIGGMT
jgi:hypothetical protein